MSLRRFSPLRSWLPPALLACSAACHAPAPRMTPAPAAPATDASHDWHVLLIAPFGSVLKEVPAALHEVLLFRDEEPGAAAADDGECYAPDSPAPRFIGRVPDEYLLCFKQDRLARIHASVRLSDADAAEVFAAACANWLQHAVPAAASPAPAGAAGSSGDCAGSAGDIRFSAHLGEESALSIVLESISDP
jgi:hypothetical protein